MGLWNQQKIVTRKLEAHNLAASRRRLWLWQWMWWWVRGRAVVGGEPRAPPHPTTVQCCVDCRMFRFRFSVWDWRVRSRGYVSVVTVQGAREWMRVSLWCSSAFHLSLYISACSRVISTLCVGDVSEGSSRCLRHEEEKSWQLIAQVDDNNRWPSSSCSHYQTWKYQRFCLVSFLCVPRAVFVWAEDARQR